MPRAWTILLLGLGIGPLGLAQSVASLESQVLSLINTARAQGTACRGGGGGVALPPLRYDPTLAQAAKRHALNMGRVGFLSHYYQGMGPRVRVARAGYAYLRMSEIIYKGNSLSPQQAVRWWLWSPVHCRAIMNPYYQEFGAGLSPVGGAWAVELAQPR
ncbi:MAG: CAP domain-containing protein [Thermaceae bacterium]|nr:CAP domain-containing protein [Thermaceae bacterium]